jgi:hypothetical protein
MERAPVWIKGRSNHKGRPLEAATSPQRGIQSGSVLLRSVENGPRLRGESGFRVELKNVSSRKKPICRISHAVFTHARSATLSVPDAGRDALSPLTNDHRDCTETGRKALKGHSKIAITFPLTSCTVISGHFSDDRHLLSLSHDYCLYNAPGVKLLEAWAPRQITRNTREPDRAFCNFSVVIVARRSGSSISTLFILCPNRLKIKKNKDRAICDVLLCWKREAVGSGTERNSSA